MNLKKNSLLFICIIFLSFSTANKNTPTRIVLTEQNKDCIRHNIRIFYYNNISMKKIIAIRNHFIAEYDVHILQHSIGYQTLPPDSLTLYRSETWSICTTGGPRPGNGGIDDEIDEEPGMGNVNNPNF